MRPIVCPADDAIPQVFAKKRLQMASVEIKGGWLNIKVKQALNFFIYQGSSDMRQNQVKHSALHAGQYVKGMFNSARLGNHNNGIARFIDDNVVPFRTLKARATRRRNTVNNLVFSSTQSFDINGIFTY
jgi:hypothetical protein